MHHAHIAERSQRTRSRVQFYRTSIGSTCSLVPILPVIPVLPVLVAVGVRRVAVPVPVLVQVLVPVPVLRSGATTSIRTNTGSSSGTSPVCFPVQVQVY
jgi:hypothetical protein